MTNIQLGKSTVLIVCSVTAILSIGFLIEYNRKKKKNKTKKLEEDLVNGFAITELIENDTVNEDNDLKINFKNDGNIKAEVLRDLIPKEWRKIGDVKELFIYPLKSGRGKNLTESVFTEYGISCSGKEKDCFLVRDRMFIVYKEETGELKTGKNYPTLVLVTLSTTDKDHVKLEAVGMPFLRFKLPEDEVEDTTSIPCILWWGETIRCIDCGLEAARWISRFLTGTNSGLRLGCCKFKELKTEGTSGDLFDSEALLEPWEKVDRVISSIGKEGTMQMSSDLASYLVMSESSNDALNEDLNRPRSALQFRPNLVVSGPEPFSEDDWEWIKIGDNVVMRNVKPHSSRTHRDARRIQIAGDPPTAGIQCGIYKTGGVRIGDDVYVNETHEIGRITREQQDQQDNRNPKFASENFLRKESGQNSLSNGLT